MIVFGKGLKIVKFRRKYKEMMKKVNMKKEIEVKIPKIVCTNCGKSNSKWRKFCQHCKKGLV